MADDPSDAPDCTVEHATCLGCGCACDDITVGVRAGRIATTRNACTLGTSWFGDGALPSRIVLSGSSDRHDLTSALTRAATLLVRAQRPLVYLAAECTCETQRAAIAIGDTIGAAVDSITSATGRDGVLAAQQRGRASATLGEIRNRTDMMLFWGVDTAVHYPRYATRYAPEPTGLFVPRGRADRTVIAVDVGSDRGPADADARVAFTADQEVPALDLLRVALLGRGRPNEPPNSTGARANGLAARLRQGRYVTIVHDGEPLKGRDPKRTEAVILLADALNALTRCAVSTLRAGGNRTGADAVMTWQTGYPMAVDFSRGSPRYAPVDDAESLLARGEVDVALLLGSSASIPERVRDALSQGVDTIVIGPRASATQFATQVAIDTGMPGIHERGTAMRLDDVMLPLRPALEPPAAAAFRARYGMGAPISVTTAAALSASSAGSPSMQPSATTDYSPELTTAAELVRRGLPQDAYIVLRALGGAVARMMGRA